MMGSKTDGLQKHMATQYILEDDFQPSQSSTLNENNDGIEITKSRGNQTISMSEVGTQTTTKNDETSDGSLKSTAVFANRLLHAAYWCLLLSTFAGTNGFPHLKKAIESRHSIYEVSAKRILTQLNIMGACVLAGIAKPDFDFQKGTINEVLIILQKLDHWILSSVNSLVMHAKDHTNIIPANEDLLKILEDVFQEQSVLAEDSKLMTEKTLITFQ